MKASKLAIAPEAIEGGIWIDKIAGCGDLRLKMRGRNNPDWERAYFEKVQAIPQHLRSNGLSDEDRRRIELECLIETALVDWGNLEDDDGSQIPVSRAMEMLQEPRWYILRRAVENASSEVYARAMANAEESAKNSVTA